MDDPNLSDAILLALRNIGWIGALVPTGSAVVTLPRKRACVRRSIPMPAGLVVPPGITWNSGIGRFMARIWVGGRGRAGVSLGTCGATQAELDALGARWQQAARLRADGATVDAIRAAVREAR